MKHLTQKLFGIVAAGRRAHTVATEAGLKEKLPEGLLDNLEKDLAELSPVSETVGAQTSFRTLTGKQNVACERAFIRASAIGRTVVRQTQNQEVRRAYGVGERLSRGLVGEVVHALATIIERVESKPEEAKSFGIGEGQLTTLKALHAEVSEADKAQEQARVRRPLTTRERNATMRRIRTAVGVISDLGVFEFGDDADKRALFQSLASRPGRTSPADASSEPTPQPPAEGSPASA